MLKNSNILIVGLGLIGGSYALELSSKGYNVYAIDKDMDAINYAKENGIIKNGNESDTDLIKNADIIIYTLYPKIIPSLIKEHMKYYKKDVFLTDTSGTKETLLNEIDDVLKGKFNYCSHHPMAGRERSGVKNAILGMFKDANFIIIDDGKACFEPLLEIANVLEFKNISFLKRKEHDEVIGYLSQLTHAIAIALMNARDTDHMIKYTGDSFRDLTRIATINERLWSELFLENSETLSNEIDLFIDSLNEIKSCLRNENKKRLKELMISSTERRAKFNK